VTGVLLRTERLVLRRLTIDDLDHLTELDADPEVLRTNCRCAFTLRSMFHANLRFADLRCSRPSRQRAARGEPSRRAAEVGQPDGPGLRKSNLYITSLLEPRLPGRRLRPGVGQV